MREPSVAVRETAAEHLEERQTDWAYSKPVVVLDVLWNLAFVAIAAAVLAVSLNEQPSVPLRAWLAGYVIQCLVHVLCVAVEYRRRQEAMARGGADQEGAGDGDFKLSIVKHLESANTMFSFIWWIIGFYWVSAGGQALSHDAPQLYWLTIVFLAFDVFFVVFCVALACVIGIAVCCCLPCIIAILYAVTDQEGASEEDINNLSKYKFRTMGDADKLVAGIAAPVGGVMTECGTSPPVEHILSAEDADCDYDMVWFQSEFHAITNEMQTLLEYASILVLGWCHHLINEDFVIGPFIVSTVTFANASVDIGDAGASCDDTFRVVIPVKAKGVPFVGLHDNMFGGAIKYHTYEQLKVDNINVIATSIENPIDEFVDLIDAKPKNAHPQVALAVRAVDTSVAPLDPTSEPTNNLVASVIARRCLHQARNTSHCANTCIIWDTSYSEVTCHGSSEHCHMDSVPHVMLLTGQEEENSLQPGRTMRILVNLGGEQLIALVDSGASHNIIGLDVANRLGLHVSRAHVHVTVANGTSMESNGICRNIRLSIGSDIFAISTYVAHIPNVDVILGALWLESLGEIMWNFSMRMMRFTYNGREIELNGLMDDMEDATTPPSLSSPSVTLLKIVLPKASLFNDIRREILSEPELAAMLDGIQKGNRGYPRAVVEGIIFYNNRLYIPLWSPILAQILNGVQQLGGFALLDEVAIGIHEPSSSPSTRSFPTSILLPQAIPQQSIQTCNVIMADYVGTEFLNVSGVIWQPPSMFTGPPRMFLDDTVMHTFFGMCIDNVCVHDRVHPTSYPTFLMFVNVFCRESKWRPFFASPPREATTFNYVRIESKDIIMPWVRIPSRSSYVLHRNPFAFKGQIGTLGFQLQLTIYGDTSNVYEHIQIGELRTLLWAMDYSIKFHRRVSTRNPQAEDEQCHRDDSLNK